MKKIFLLVLLFISFSLVSCAPAPFKPFEPDKITFASTKKYSIQQELEKIPKPSQLERIYAKKIGDTTFITVKTPEKADHIILVPKEYAKVAALKELAITYKETVLKQEVLINIYIDQINSLKELVVLEQKKSTMYRQMWTDSENAYRHERWKHEWNNRINRTSMYIVTIGSIIAVLLAF